MRKLLIYAIASASLMAQAQPIADYPAKPIRFILISGAGSGGDTVGRMLADKMAPLIGGSFFIDNKPGAGGAIATELAAKAPPDGYTIALGGSTTHVMLPASNSKLRYDPVKDFSPIGQVGNASILLIATNDFPANNVRELRELAKKTPGGLQYASWGIGSTGHFCGELFNQQAQAQGQAQIAHISYKSVAQIQTDILGGHVKLAFVDMASGSPMVKAGRVKAITTCLSRTPSLPNVSSYEDEGINLGGKRLNPFRFALYAPAGTPKPIIDKLSAALKTTLEMADVKTRLLDLGITAAFIGGAELTPMNIEDIVAWKQIAKSANITND
jgi:tripartite-type tricarboxylate transporter receptor subunit TctC